MSPPRVLLVEGHPGCGHGLGLWLEPTGAIAEAIVCAVSHGLVRVEMSA